MYRNKIQIFCYCIAYDLS